MMAIAFDIPVEIERITAGLERFLRAAAMRIRLALHVREGRQGRFVKGDLIAHAVMEKRAGWGTGYPAEWDPRSL